MSDLVERLRWASKVYRSHQEYEMVITRDAADRIEELEAEVERLSTDNIDPENIHFVMSHPEAVARQMTRDTERIKALEAEVERLEGERSGLRYTVKGLIAANRQMADRIENLEAKVERLREALRAIRDQEWTENALDPQWAGRIARAALAGEGDG